MDPVSADIVAQSESPTTILRWFTVVCMRGPAIAYEHILDRDADAAGLQFFRANPDPSAYSVFEGKLYPEMQVISPEESSDDAEPSACDCDHVVLSETPRE
jgi:hypothetical protein